MLNGKVVDYAVKAGLATNCTIARYSKQDRKNYFYPDLPKAYQISQYERPLCKNGSVEIVTDRGSKKIGITRIHIEEDAGKLVHDAKLGTLIDCNRCGIPLIEIVSEPDLRLSLIHISGIKKKSTATDARCLRKAISQRRQRKPHEKTARTGRIIVHFRQW